MIPLMDKDLLAHLDDVATKCLHCGLCLPVCPTYSLSLREESSPRGRIRLIQAVNLGTMPVSDEFAEEMYFCLDCQACQTACPAGVRYGELVEQAREGIAASGKDPGFVGLLKKIFLNGILGSSTATKLAAKFFRLYTRSGIREAVDASGILTLFPWNVSELHRLLPPVSDQPFDETVPEVITPPGVVRGRVGFLTGCIMNVSFAEIHKDALDVLLANGYEVVIPRGQVCCGSLHAHNGDEESARRLARINIGIFSKFSIDALVIDSAGCGAFMKEYGKLFAGDPDLSGEAAELAGKTKDIMEFLADMGLRNPPYPVDAVVTYHEACHLVHSQRVSRQPREILSQIKGIRLIELPEATWCCGSAGIYNIVRYPDAVKLLERKMGNVAGTGAAIVLAANPGCQIQMQYGAERFDVPVEILHPVSVLARAYRGGG